MLFPAALVVARVAMAELERGVRVSVSLPKGRKLAEIEDSRAGFYLCRFDDGAKGWVDARDVRLSDPPPSPVSGPPSATPLRSHAPPSGYPSAQSDSQPEPYAPQPAYAAPVERGPSRPPVQPGAYTCAACGGANADYWPKHGMPLHRHCAGLGPDVLSWPWLLFAYGVVVPFGCSLIGAVMASIPYYVWRRHYPERARSYNRHVWFGFGGSILMWMAFGALVALSAPRHH